MRFHDLRHSTVTLLAGMGVPLKVVQEIVGHSDIAMTADIYAHVLPAMQKDAMGRWLVAALFPSWRSGKASLEGLWCVLPGLHSCDYMVNSTT